MLFDLDTPWTVDSARFISKSRNTPFEGWTLRGRAVRVFVRPGGLARAQVCATSGLLPTPLCRRRATEWFIAGTEPRDADASYRRVAVDSATGLAWDATCQGRRLERVMRLLPGLAPPDARRPARPQRGQAGTV